MLRWTPRQDLAPAQAILADHDTPIAADVLAGIERTDQRERSSIFSATAGVLAAYNSDAVRAAAVNPNFDPDQFATSTDTIYITAPEHKQALCAPLIVGLLEQIRHAVRGESFDPLGDFFFAATQRQPFSRLDFARSFAFRWRLAVDEFVGAQFEGPTFVERSQDAMQSRCCRSYFRRRKGFRLFRCSGESRGCCEREDSQDQSRCR